MTHFIDPRLKDALSPFWPNLAAIGSHVSGAMVLGTGETVMVTDPATGRHPMPTQAPRSRPRPPPAPLPGSVNGAGSPPPRAAAPCKPFPAPSLLTPNHWRG
jgi:hypothetical protein